MMGLKIAVTGARGLVGKEVVKLAKSQGHYVIQINRTKEKEENDPNSEQREAEATDYDAMKEAFKGAEAVIHLAAIPNPEGKPDHVVHNTNVQGGYNAMHAAASLGIKRFSLASSVNAHGLVYSKGEIVFPAFPLDESMDTFPSDAYALSKAEVEMQADSLVRTFPGFRVASFRIHEVSPLKDIERTEDEDARQLWAWVNPVATARACLLGVTAGEFEGHERFYVVAPTTVRKETSPELAKKYYPDVPIKGDISGHKGFFSTAKAKKLLGWEHHETE